MIVSTCAFGTCADDIVFIPTLAECEIKGQKYYTGPPDNCAPCNGTCEEPNPPCPELCTSGCACPNGKVVKDGKKCVKAKRCPKKG